MESGFGIWCPINIGEALGARPINPPTPYCWLIEVNLSIFEDKISSNIFYEVISPSDHFSMS